ncbi:MAG: 7-cyano-7-deazaguanine synthase [Clostridia bacterium]|nr:7-cyano-7-deazaguanine synthase [Clostridia bacterium]
MSQNEINPYLEKILSSKKGDSLDCVVMFSGGKDSTYLLYLLKEVYKKRIIAVSVDNGFEDVRFSENAEEIAKGLGISYVNLNDAKPYFKLFYESAVKESEYFSKFSSINYLCVLCNYILWGRVVKYASEQNIPYVVSGLDPGQLNYEGEIHENANNIAARQLKFTMNKIKEAVKETKNYSENELYRKFMDETLTFPAGITSVFPYIYLEYNVDHIKEVVLGKTTWKPPFNFKTDQYMTSGCRIIHMLYEMESLGIIKTQEKEQIKFLYEKGAVSQSLLDRMDPTLLQRVINFKNPIYDELNIKDFIKSKCKECNVTFHE